MREIKFRVWNGKTMLFDTYIGQEIIRYEKGILDFETINNAIPMQYTECKDKNGKEIYEGDILKLKSGKIHEVEREV